MTLRINAIAPDFTADTTGGPIRFHEWIGDSWVLFFAHPKDFTPVCTTELGAVAGLKHEFDRRNTKVIGLSIDGVADHERWSDDVHRSQGHAINHPLIGDPTLAVAKAYGMLPADAGDTAEGRTAADNATARTVYIIGPDKRIKMTMTYPMTTGRNFVELLRVLDSLQLTASIDCPCTRRGRNDHVHRPHSGRSSRPSSATVVARPIALAAVPARDRHAAPSVPPPAAVRGGGPSCDLGRRDPPAVTARRTRDDDLRQHGGGHRLLAPSRHATPQGGRHGGSTDRACPVTAR